MLLPSQSRTPTTKNPTSASKLKILDIIRSLVRPATPVRELTTEDVWVAESSTPKIMKGVFMILPDDDPDNPFLSWWSAVDRFIDVRRWDFTKRTDEDHKLAAISFEGTVRRSTYRLKRLGTKETCGYLREIFTIVPCNNKPHELRIAYLCQRRPRLYTHTTGESQLEREPPKTDARGPGRTMFSIETFEIIFQAPPEASARWKALWKETAAVNLWQFAPQQRREWLDYFSDILTGLARWLPDWGGLSSQKIDPNRFRIPNLGAFPNRFNLLDTDIATISTALAILDSIPYARIVLPVRYVTRFSNVHATPHWTGGVFEGDMMGTSGSGALRVYDRFYVGMILQDTPHGRGRLYHIARPDDQILSFYWGDFYYGSKHGRGEEWVRMESGNILTVGNWHLGELKQEILRDHSANSIISWQSPIKLLAGTEGADEPTDSSNNSTDENKEGATELTSPSSMLRLLLQSTLTDSLTGSVGGGSSAIPAPQGSNQCRSSEPQFPYSNTAANTADPYADESVLLTSNSP